MANCAAIAPWMGGLDGIGDLQRAAGRCGSTACGRRCRSGGGSCCSRAAARSCRESRSRGCSGRRSRRTFSALKSSSRSPRALADQVERGDDEAAAHVAVLLATSPSRCRRGSRRTPITSGSTRKENPLALRLAPVRPGPFLAARRFAGWAARSGAWPSLGADAGPSEQQKAGQQDERLAVPIVRTHGVS